MFLSMQSLNGDSYQGAQVGVNVQSQVGAKNRDRSCVQMHRAVPVLPVCWAIHSAVWSTVTKTCCPHWASSNSHSQVSTAKVSHTVSSIFFFTDSNSLWMEYSGLPKNIPPHCYQQLFLKDSRKCIYLISVTDSIEDSHFVNAFGFDLSSWVGVGFYGPLHSSLVSFPVFVSFWLCCILLLSSMMLFLQVQRHIEEHNHTHVRWTH